VYDSSSRKDVIHGCAEAEHFHPKSKSKDAMMDLLRRSFSDQRAGKREGILDSPNEFNLRGDRVKSNTRGARAA
jgi:hypothetical protein